MKKRADPNELARMFVALELPEGVRALIEEWGGEELTDPALRRVASESLHVTLAFLGNRPLGDVERIEYAMEMIAEHPIPLELKSPVGRPARGRPKVVALPVNSNPVVIRQTELADWLVFEKLYERPRKPFWPHVTVARVRMEGGGRSRRPMAVRIPSGPSPTASWGWFEAVRLSLYRSELEPRGARYVPLAQVELPNRGWQ